MRRSTKKADKQEKAAADGAAATPLESKQVEPASADASAVSIKDTVDELLRRLEDGARATSPAVSPLDRVTTAATEHVEALRATHDAQHQAQEMLAMAGKVRGAASEQAEKIVREAQEAAERLKDEAQRHADQVRQETANWAIEQRTTIDAALRELVDAAARDAEGIRADALGNAMRDAERTARRYVARAAALGARDAEAIRAEARDVLRRSTGLVADANVWMQGMATTMKEFVGAMDEQTRAMEQLLDEAQNRVEENRWSGAVDDDEELDSLIDEALDAEKAETSDSDATQAGDDESAEAAPSVAPAKKPVTRSAAKATPKSAPKPAPKPAAGTDPEPADGGRPLGSLFRGPDAR